MRKYLLLLALALVGILLAYQLLAQPSSDLTPVAMVSLVPSGTDTWTPTPSNTLPSALEVSLVPSLTPAPTLTPGPTPTIITITVDSTSLLPRPTPTARTILWSADFETGNFSQWLVPGRITGLYRGGGLYNDGTGQATVTDKVTHSGRYAAEMTIDTAVGHSQAVRLFRWGENPTEGYYSVWYMFPETYYASVWWNVFQFKSKASYPKDTLWVMNIGNRANGAMYFYLFDWQLRRSYVQGRKDIPIGQWMQIEAYYRASTSNAGRITVWQDGVLLFDLDGVQTSSSSEVQWSVDNFTDSISPSPATIYIDDAVISRVRTSP